jgi:hypothetical protein
MIKSRHSLSKLSSLNLLNLTVMMMKHDIGTIWKIFTITHAVFKMRYHTMNKGRSIYGLKLFRIWISAMKT